MGRQSKRKKDTWQRRLTTDDCNRLLFRVVE
jgi:hypothetical protein